MQTVIKKDGDVVLVGLTGRLDASSAQLFEKRIEALVAQNERKFIVDMAKLAYISSSGLRVLLAAVKKIRLLGGILVLCNVSGTVKEIILISGFDTFIAIYKDLAGATEALH